MYKRKHRQPQTFEEIRDRGSAYRQSYAEQPNNNPDNDAHQNYISGKGQSDTGFGRGNRHGERAGSLTAKNVFKTDPHQGLDPQFYSAPPTRDGSYGYEAPEPTLNSIKLTPAQVEVAKFSGLSIEEYARQLLALAKAKKRDPFRYAGQG
jgi:hypothetical protein